MNEIFSAYRNNFKIFALERVKQALQQHFYNKDLKLEIQHKKTLVIGASPRAYRYSYSAVLQLDRFGHPVIALGLRESTIGEINIVTGFPKIENVHTVTLYVGPQNQSVYFDYILNSIKPQRIIFNPGTENDDLYNSAKKQNIEVVENCTLMMLANGLY